MSRKIRLKKISQKLTHIRRQSPTANKAKWVVTLALVAALIVSVTLWGIVRQQRLRRKDGAVQVSVGTSIMAHIVPDELTKEEEMDLAATLNAYGVRPTSMQQVLLMGDEFSIETTGQELKSYALEPVRHGVVLWRENEKIGVLQWIVLPNHESETITEE